MMENDVAALSKRVDASEHHITTLGRRLSESERIRVLRDVGTHDNNRHIVLLSQLIVGIAERIIEIQSRLGRLE